MLMEIIFTATEEKLAARFLPTCV